MLLDEDETVLDEVLVLLVGGGGGGGGGGFPLAEHYVAVQDVLNLYH